LLTSRRKSSLEIFRGLFSVRRWPLLRIPATRSNLKLLMEMKKRLYPEPLNLFARC